MVYQATQEIYDRLKREENCKVFIEEWEKSSCVWLQVGIKNGGSYRIWFINSDDDNDTAVRVFKLLSVDQDKIPQILKTINKLNGRFRFVKFVCDDDGGVDVEYDFPVRIGNLADCADEMVVHLYKIIDKAYPELMKALWS